MSWLTVISNKKKIADTKWSAATSVLLRLGYSKVKCDGCNEFFHGLDCKVFHSKNNRKFGRMPKPTHIVYVDHIFYCYKCRILLTSDWTSCRCPIDWEEQNKEGSK